MRFCAAVGSAGLPWFTELNIKSLRHVFGADLPIVITEDPSPSTSRVMEIAGENDCYIHVSEQPLGHFQGDVQTYLDALALASQTQADIAIKVSQRFFVVDPRLREMISTKFEADPNLAVVCPGRPNPNLIRTGHKQFARFPLLTDIFFMRRSHIDPDFVKAQYEKQVKEGRQYWDCFVELFWERIRNGSLNGRVHLAPELTDHRGAEPKLYIRRYQDSQSDYLRLAQYFKVTGSWQLGERASLDKRYDPRPRL